MSTCGEVPTLYWEMSHGRCPLIGGVCLWEVFASRVLPVFIHFRGSNVHIFGRLSKESGGLPMLMKLIEARK